MRRGPLRQCWEAGLSLHCTSSRSSPGRQVEPTAVANNCPINAISPGRSVHRRGDFLPWCRPSSFHSHCKGATMIVHSSQRRPKRRKIRSFTMAVCPWVRQQPFISDSLQFGIGNGPFFGISSPARSLFCMDPTVAAPLANRKLCFVKQFRDFAGRIPLSLMLRGLNGATDLHERCFDVRQSRLNQGKNFGDSAVDDGVRSRGKSAIFGQIVDIHLRFEFSEGRWWSLTGLALRTHCSVR